MLDVEPKYGPLSAGANSMSGLLNHEVAGLMGRIPVGSSYDAVHRSLKGRPSGAHAPSDREIIDRLAADGTSEIARESIRPALYAMASFLNLRFPASDLSANTREMLKLNSVRNISAPAASVCAVPDKKVPALDLIRDECVQSFTGRLPPRSPRHVRYGIAGRVRRRRRHSVGISRGAQLHKSRAPVMRRWWWW